MYSKVCFMLPLSTKLVPINDYRGTYVTRESFCFGAIHSQFYNAKVPVDTRSTQLRPAPVYNLESW